MQTLRLERAKANTYVQQATIFQSGKFKTNQIAYYNQELNPETH